GRRVHGLILLAGERLAHTVAIGARGLDESGLDLALRWFRHTFHQRPVGLRGGAGLEDAAELGGDVATFGDEQHAGRVTVEAVDEPRPVAEAIDHPGEKPVDMPLRARAALDGNAERLVE